MRLQVPYFVPYYVLLLSTDFPYVRHCIGNVEIVRFDDVAKLLTVCLFTTSKGLDFTYKIRGGEMFVDRKEKSITRATVMKAYGKVVELDGAVKGPKVLGTFGASYLYSIFVKMGLIKTTGA